VKVCEGTGLGTVCQSVFLHVFCVHCVYISGSVYRAASGEQAPRILARISINCVYEGMLRG
jgi:hypothetical protein